MIDLRSDTVTGPTPDMRKAMMEAEVGDDVYGEDPTVNRLQEILAEITGKEDALLVTSGTQGNQIAILTHCLPGTEVILEKDSHIFIYEVGAGAALAGVQFYPVVGDRGSLPAELVTGAIRANDIHLPPTSLICIENTHNRAGGAVVPLEKLRDLYAVACRHGIPVHLDGARLFNASIASGVPVREYASLATTVQICLSKGLGAPVGSLIAGPKKWINAARRWRKRLGGGMRQAGIIAAPGIIALQTMVSRLSDDHANARFLAEGLASIQGVEIRPEQVETNIVIFSVSKMTALNFIEAMRKRGVLATYFGNDKIRMTTHKDVSRGDMETTLSAASAVLGR